jgi:hypothetical protein
LTHIRCPFGISKARLNSLQTEDRQPMIFSILLLFPGSSQSIQPCYQAEAAACLSRAAAPANCHLGYTPHTPTRRSPSPGRGCAARIAPPFSDFCSDYQQPFESQSPRCRLRSTTILEELLMAISLALQWMIVAISASCRLMRFRAVFTGGTGRHRTI